MLTDEEAHTKQKETLNFQVRSPDFPSCVRHVLQVQIKGDL